MAAPNAAFRTQAEGDEGDGKNTATSPDHNSNITPKDVFAGDGPQLEKSSTPAVRVSVKIPPETYLAPPFLWQVGPRPSATAGATGR